MASHISERPFAMLSLDAPVQEMIKKTDVEKEKDKAKKQDENERELILQRVKVHQVTNKYGLYNPQRLSLMNPADIYSCKKTVCAYSALGAATGGTIGFVAGGGPNPVGCIAAGGGILVGASIGAGVGLGVYMSKTSNDYKKWREAQTQETLDKFKELLMGSEFFREFEDPDTLDFMQFPTSDAFGHVVDYQTYDKYLKHPSSKDNVKTLIEHGQKIDNPNYGHSRCYFKCHYIKPEDLENRDNPFLRPDYFHIGKLIMAITRFIDGKAIPLKDINPEFLKGLTALKKDLMAKAYWSADLEEAHYLKLWKEGKIKKSEYQKKSGAINEAVDR